MDSHSLDFFGQNSYYVLQSSNPFSPRDEDILGPCHAVRPDEETVSPASYCAGIAGSPRGRTPRESLSASGGYRKV